MFISSFNLKYSTSLIVDLIKPNCSNTFVEFSFDKTNSFNASEDYFKISYTALIL